MLAPMASYPLWRCRFGSSPYLLVVSLPWCSFILIKNEKEKKRDAGVGDLCAGAAAAVI